MAYVYTNILSIHDILCGWGREVFENETLVCRPFAVWHINLSRLYVLTLNIWTAYAIETDIRNAI